jgi:catechol 2,3-dioxygenase-like lactoylglutathione lyase family enzyme
MSIETSGFAHVNLNCTSLARSKPFFEQAFGLRALVHTTPGPQDCSAFGMDVPGPWDAWMLGHTEPGAGIALDLLEWLQPRPLPGPHAGALGFASLTFEVPGLDGERTRLDPDGFPLVLKRGSRNRLASVAVVCRDLERSLRFYEEVLGLKRVSNGDGALALPGDASGFRVQLSPWRGAGEPAPAALEPHRIGLFRMAFVVSDIERQHAELRRLGVSGLSPVADLHLGPDCPAPRCRAVFFRDPSGACLELIEVPAA